MAKKEMICPFSSKLCRECPIYRGRHYFLCFNLQYRGHITGINSDTKNNTFDDSEHKTKEFIQIPKNISNAFDPFEIPVDD